MKRNCETICSLFPSVFINEQKQVCEEQRPKARKFILSCFVTPFSLKSKPYTQGENVHYLKKLKEKKKSKTKKLRTKYIYNNIIIIGQTGRVLQFGAVSPGGADRDGQSDHTFVRFSDLTAGRGILVVWGRGAKGVSTPLSTPPP